MSSSYINAVFNFLIYYATLNSNIFCPVSGNLQNHRKLSYSFITPFNIIYNTH